MTNENLGTNVDKNADVQTECAEGHGIGRRLKVVATTVTALALAACGNADKANAQDVSQKAPEVVQQVKMNIDTPIAETIQMTELPEVMSYIDNDGNFSFALCKEAGYDAKGCLKFRNEYKDMLIAAENRKQDESSNRTEENLQAMIDSLNN